jgi:hypothetical protein
VALPVADRQRSTFDGKMKALLPILILLVATSAVGGDPPEHLLPKSLTWREASIHVDGIEIPFRIAKIAETLTLSEIEKPLEDDRKELMSFVSKFIHEWDFVRDFKRLQDFFEPTDSFQKAGEKFSGLTRPEPDAGSRIYTHMIEREGFYYLLGVKHKENGTTQKVIGTYIWKGDRFYAVLFTPEFLKSGGREFRAALRDFDFYTNPPSENNETPQASVEHVEGGKASPATS